MDRATADLALPAVLAGAIASAGAGTAYVVGGYVRDRLLGRPVRDLDLAVSGEPRPVANRIAAALGGSAFPLSELHRAWRVTLDTPVAAIEQIDVAALRGAIDADLRERDFTVNAIGVRPDGTELRDPSGGIADLAAHRLRLVTPGAIEADPIRALRAVRHAAELGFIIEDGSAAVIRRDARLVARAAGERQRDEIMRAFETGHGGEAVRLIDTLDLLDVVLPELHAAKGCLQPKEHYWDVFDHSVETVAVLDCILGDTAERTECRRRVDVLRSGWPVGTAARWDEPIGEGRTRRAVLKLIGLLHDVSKPATRTIEPDGRTRFFGHPEHGAVVAGEVFRRLRFSAREVRLAEMLIKDHLRPGQLASPGEPPTARALFRLFRDLGEDVPDLLVLNLADGAAAAGPRQTVEQWRMHVAYTGWILRQRQERETLTRPQRLLTGHELIAELGMEPGPEVGRVLDALTEATAAGEIETRDQALALARRLTARTPR